MAGRAHRPPSSRGYDRHSCGQRNRCGGPETCRRPPPEVRSQQSPAARAGPRRSCLRSWVAGGLLGVPVEDLLAVPVHDAFEPVHIVVDRFEKLDPERLAADVGMDCERQDFRADLALFVQPVEAIYGALEQMIALVML